MYWQCHVSRPVNGAVPYACINHSFSWHWFGRMRCEWDAKRDIAVISLNLYSITCTCYKYSDTKQNYILKSLENLSLSCLLCCNTDFRHCSCMDSLEVALWKNHKPLKHPETSSTSGKLWNAKVSGYLCDKCMYWNIYYKMVSYDGSKHCITCVTLQHFIKR